MQIALSTVTCQLVAVVTDEVAAAAEPARHLPPPTPVLVLVAAGTAVDSDHSLNHHFVGLMVVCLRCRPDSGWGEFEGGVPGHLDLSGPDYSDERDSYGHCHGHTHEAGAEAGESFCVDL